MKLFVSSYAGTITTLSLIVTGPDKYALNQIASTTSCAPTPSWLSLDLEKNLVYCTNAGVPSNSQNGTLNALTIQPDGSLLPLSSVNTPVGAAHMALYGNKQAMGIAFYVSGFLGTYNVQIPKTLKVLQSHSLPVPPLVNQSRPHEIIPDPSGNYVLVPDLVADVVRIFQISHEAETLDELIEINPLRLSQGSGPRHGLFLELNGKLIFYVITQTANTLVAFWTEYSDTGSLSFQQIQEVNLLLRLDGSLIVPPTGVTIMAAEIQISSDKRFLTASLRGDSNFTIDSPVSPGTMISSDSLLTYEIEASSGNLTLKQAAPAGGSFPRQFSFNDAGDLVAVAVQNMGWVAVLQRDVATGNIRNIVAVSDGLGIGGVVCVLWAEKPVVIS